jgi:hypothetical protein
MKVVVLLLFWAFPGSSSFRLSLLLPSRRSLTTLPPLDSTPQTALFKFANWCLTWLPSDDAQVVFVMLIFPRALRSSLLLWALRFGVRVEDGTRRRRERNDADTFSCASLSSSSLRICTVVMNLFQFLTSTSCTPASSIFCSALTFAPPSLPFPLSLLPLPSSPPLHLPTPSNPPPPVDSILKSKSPLSSAFLDTPHPDDDGESRRGFLEPSSDDLDDDDDERYDDESMPAKGGKVGVEGDSGYARSPEEGFDGSMGGRASGTPLRSSTLPLQQDGDRTPRANTVGHSYPPTLPSNNSNTPAAISPKPPPGPKRLSSSSYGAADVSPPSTPLPPPSSRASPPPPPPPSFRSLSEKQEAPSSFSPSSSSSYNEKSIPLGHTAPATTSLPPQRRDSTTSEQEEEEEEDDSWGADWGASMTSLELVREVEGMMGKSSPALGGEGRAVGEREKVQVQEEVDVGDDWGFEAEAGSEEEVERERQVVPPVGGRKVRVD